MFSAASPSTWRDGRVRDYVNLSRVLWRQGEVLDVEALLGDGTHPITLSRGRGCRLVAGAPMAGVLLDFGRELSGGVQIGVAALSGSPAGDKTVRLRVRFGESASEAMSELSGRDNAGNDHAVRDQICKVPWLGTQEVGNTGFRFVRLDLVDEGPR